VCVPWGPNIVWELGEGSFDCGIIYLGPEREGVRPRGEGDRILSRRGRICKGPQAAPKYLSLETRGWGGRQVGSLGVLLGLCLKDNEELLKDFNQ